MFAGSPTVQDSAVLIYVCPSFPLSLPASPSFLYSLTPLLGQNIPSFLIPLLSPSLFPSSLLKPSSFLFPHISFPSPFLLRCTQCHCSDNYLLTCLCHHRPPSVCRCHLCPVRCPPPCIVMPCPSGRKPYKGAQIRDSHTNTCALSFFCSSFSRCTNPHTCRPSADSPSSLLHCPRG